jgi:WD40 repeat protein
MVLLTDGSLASGSGDKTIRIWNLQSGETLQILNGHSGGVFCLAVLENDFLASGSADKTIRIWRK